VANKGGKTYETAGAPVDLVLYYRKQYPPPSEYLSEIIEETQPSLNALLKAQGGPFDRVWMFDFWKDRILLSI
jgi:hypothetical protein